MNKLERLLTATAIGFTALTGCDAPTDLRPDWYDTGRWNPGNDWNGWNKGDEWILVDGDSLKFTSGSYSNMLRVKPEGSTQEITYKDDIGNNLRIDAVVRTETNPEPGEDSTRVYISHRTPEETQAIKGFQQKFDQYLEEIVDYKLKAQREFTEKRD